MLRSKSTFTNIEGFQMNDKERLSRSFLMTGIRRNHPNETSLNSKYIIGIIARSTRRTSSLRALDSLIRKNTPCEVFVRLLFEVVYHERAKRVEWRCGELDPGPNLALKASLRRIVGVSV